MKKNIYGLLFILILVLGILLRGQETFSHNFLFLLDQGRDMMDVKGILYDHHLTLIGPSTSLRGVFQGPLWYYLLAISAGIFGGDPWGGIVLMFVISISVLIVVYFLTRKLFGERTAIFTLFLFAISPEAVAAATYTWNPHPMWALMVLYIFFFYQLIALNKKRFHFVVWPIVSLMFHFQTALAVFVLSASLIFLLLFKRKIILQKYFLYGIILASIFFVPQVLFDLRHDFLMTKSIFNIFLGDDRGLFVGGENRNYLDLIRNNMSLFYYNFSTSFVRDGYLKDFPRVVLFIIIGSLILQKKFRLFSEKEWRFLSIITGVVGIIAIISFVYPFPLRYWFFTGFQAVYIVVFGLILNKIWKWTIGKAVILVFGALLLFYAGERIYNLYFSPFDYGGTHKIKGKIDALDYIYQDAKGERFGLLVFTPPVYTYPYDYLIWWHGGQQYNYIPHQEKKGTFYLLIEKDASKSWTYKGWLETVIRVGKVVKTVELPSGFIIEKRVEENEKI